MISKIPELRFRYRFNSQFLELYHEGQNQKPISRMQIKSSLEDTARNAVDAALNGIPISKIIITDNSREVLIDYIRIRTKV